MKIGVNCLALKTGHECGAKEVLLNLCHGWHESGYDDKLVFFCYPGKNSEAIRSICPGAEVVELVEKRFTKVNSISVNAFQTLYFHTIYKKYDLSAILFVMPGVGLFKYKVPVAVIPHDIQNVSHPENFVNDKHPKLEYIVNKWFYGNDFAKVNKIVAISDVDKKEISDCYPKYAEKTFRIYDPIRFEAKANITAQKENTVVATNIQYEHKNAITLIKAFEIFSKNHPDYKLYMIGKISDFVKQELIPYVENHDLKDSVVFTGFISRDELEQRWSTARIYVNPSRYEGFGMTAVESVMIGAPTILASLDVNKEVTENMCCYYGEAGDYQSLAENMEEILKREVVEQELIDSSNRLKEKYSYKNISSQYWNMLMDICE